MSERIDRKAKETCPTCGSVTARGNRARHARRCSGSPLLPGESPQRRGARSRQTTAEDVMSKVDRGESEECWMWLGAVTDRGYGSIRMGGRTRLAHRLVYEISKGPIPEGLVLDHLCRNTTCVNPDHLEAVTTAENNRRGLKGFELTGLCRAGKHGKSGWQKKADGTWLCIACVAESRAALTEEES